MPTPQRQSVFSAAVKSDSPMHGIFENNLVPVISVHTQYVQLGEGPFAPWHHCYFVDVKACTEVEREGIARLMHKLGQGTLEEARAKVATLEPIPVREQNISGVSFPLRFII